MVNKSLKEEIIHTLTQ